MPVDHIRYDLLTQQALRAVVRRVLVRRGQDRQPAGRASFLRHVRHPLARREALAAAARAVSGRDDHRAAAPVLGSRRSPRRISRWRCRSTAYPRSFTSRSTPSRASSIRRCSSACSSRPSTEGAREISAEPPAAGGAEARQAAAQAGHRRAGAAGRDRPGHPGEVRAGQAGAGKDRAGEGRAREGRAEAAEADACGGGKARARQAARRRRSVRLDRFRKK